MEVPIVERAAVRIGKLKDLTRSRDVIKTGFDLTTTRR